MAWFVLRQLLFFFFFNGSHSFPCCRYARFGDTVENTERKKKPLECRNKILGQQIEAYWVLDTRSSKSPTPKPGFRAFESVPVSRLKISATHWEKNRFAFPRTCCDILAAVRGIYASTLHWDHLYFKGTSYCVEGSGLAVSEALVGAGPKDVRCPPNQFHILKRSVSLHGKLQRWHSLPLEFYLLPSSRAKRQRSEAPNITPL